MNRLIATSVALLTLTICSSGSAQVLYEPVQYQYHFASSSFYYGGTEARVFRYAAAAIQARDYSSVARTIHAVCRGYVYSGAGALGNGFENVHTGYRSFTANDARNEAYASLPRYFRKRDLLAAAIPVEDGTWIVPAQLKPRMEIRVVRPFAVDAAPVVPKGTILILPRKFFEKKVKAEPMFVEAR